MLIQAVQKPLSELLNTWTSMSVVAISALDSSS
jgi:hypothetical protein